ncbi:MAG: CopG family transcriptional regulator [Syntrophomonadaceae bacterium]|nr:CopG family transcriptional regulator [Syntrophomonadaceae bacterium]
MEYQNITLSLPKDVLKRVKHLAVERDTSVSALLANFLEEILQKEEAYQKARLHHLTMLEGNLDLGTNGRITWNREALHER